MHDQSHERALGLSAAAALSPGALELYRLLLATRDSDRSIAAGRASDLAQLVEIGLVDTADDKLQAVAPYRPMDQLVRATATAHASMREAADQLETAWRERADVAAEIELFEADAAGKAIGHVLTGTRNVVALQRPTRSRARPADGVMELLAQGVHIRVVYDASLMSDPAALDVVRSCVDAGEQARILPAVPVSLIIGDTSASLGLPGSRPDLPDRVLIRSPRLVMALREVFESYWRMALPLSRSEAAPASREDDIALLTLLAAGLSDHSIGRELGISERTMRRRISSLQATLGAQTRFQLGVQAVRQGWIEG